MIKKITPPPSPLSKEEQDALIAEMNQQLKNPDAKPKEQPPQRTGYIRIDVYDAVDALYQLATILEAIRRNGSSPEGWGDFYQLCLGPINHYRGNKEEEPEWAFHSPHPPVGVGVPIFSSGGDWVADVRPPDTVRIIDGEISYRVCLNRWEYMRMRVIGEQVTHPRILAMREHFTSAIESLEYHRWFFGRGRVNSA